MREFKSTSLPWLTQIPHHWKEVRIKDIGVTRNGLTYKPDDLVEKESGTIVLRSSNIQNSRLSFDDNVYVASFPDELRVKKNDIIICSRNGSVSLVGKCALIEDDIDATFGAFMMRFRTAISPKYTYYLLQSTIAAYKGLFGTTTVNQLTNSVFGNMLTCVPPLAEQEAIAAYLDKECEKIGREIELLERKADSYRRLRRSLINRVVTRGLNPNVSLKHSGLRWIPLIPAHWTVGRVRNFFNYRNEKVSEIDFAPLSVTKNGVVPQMENVAKSMAEGDTRKKVCKNDFVVNSRSDRKGSCGTAPLDGSVSLIYIVLEPTSIDPIFANYYFRCNDWIEEFYRNGKGIVADLWTTNYSAMRNIEIAVPNLQEQKQIAGYLDEKCGKIDAIVEKIETKIERLKQLKRSLINEVVTGQRAIKNN